MENKPTTHHDLIKALGGPVNLARALGIGNAVPTTVHWKQRGIPSRYWHRVVELAAAQKIAVTSHDLERMPACAEAV